MHQFNSIMSAEGECQTSHWQVSMNLEAYAELYQLGQKTTIVDCVSNRPLPYNLYSPPSAAAREHFYQPKTFKLTDCWNELKENIREACTLLSA